jgi:flagellar biosynthesis/type III secretory pathway M-ring protein FliF/YscJ
MSQATDREEWSRIQSDEDAAQRKQQMAAGPSHSPVLGPGPHGDHGTNIAVEAATERERERCAQLIEVWSQDQPEEVARILRSLAGRMRAG